MDRLTRKAIKSDKFAEEVTHGWEFLTDHTGELKRYGSIALAVIVIAAGIYFYHNHAMSSRQEALAQAMKADPALVPTQTPPVLSDDQVKARIKLYEPIASQDHGTIEGAIAQMMLASIQAQKATPEGFAAAEKLYQDVVDSAPKDYSSVARKALAMTYASEGKTDQAKSTLQYVIDHPTTLVSKEDATLQLAQILEKSNPTEAKNLLTSLVKSPSAVISRAAVNELGQLQR